MNVFNIYVYENRSMSSDLSRPLMLENLNVDNVQIHIPKEIDGTDMGTWAWWFVYQNAKREKYSIPMTLEGVTNDEGEEEYISTVGLNHGFTGKHGTVMYAIEALQADGSGTVTHEWHTKTYKLEVIYTLQGNQTEYDETETDIISALISRVNELIQSGAEIAEIAETIENAAETAQEVIDSIPSDYSALSAQVDTNTEDIGGLKADLDATDDIITFVAGGLFPEWKIGGMYSATGIEYISYSSIITGFINVSPGAVINIKKPSEYSVNILEFAENVDTSSGVNERLSIKYFTRGEQTKITLGNSTNYIRVQVNQSDVSKGYDVLLQSESGSVYEQYNELNNAINYMQQDVQLADIEATWVSGKVIRNPSTHFSELSASNQFACSGFVKVTSDTNITIADGYRGFAWFAAYDEFGHAIGDISSGYNSGKVTYAYDPTFPYVIICVKRSDNEVITTEEAKNSVVISEFGKTIFATKAQVEKIAGISASIVPTKGQVCYIGDTKSNSGYICNAIAYADGVIIAARSSGTVGRIGYSGTEETLLSLTGERFDWRCLWMDSNENVYASPHASWGKMNVTDRGLYRLAKGGSSFTKVLSLYDPSSQVTTEAQNNDDTIWTMCEDAYGNLYAGVYAHTVRANPAIYKSTDGGLTWTYAFNFNTAGLTTNGKHIHTIIFSKWQNALYCIVGEVNTIFKSTDGSETWTNLHVTLTIKGSSMLATEYGIFIGSDGAYNCDIDILYPDDTTHKKVYRGWANTVFAIRQSDVTGILYAFTKIDSSVNSLAYYPPVAALEDPDEITAWLASEDATHKADWQAYYDSMIDIYPDDAIRPQHYSIIASCDGGMTWSPVKVFSCVSTAANGCWTTGFFINGECLTGRMENHTSMRPIVISEGKHKYVSGGCDFDGEIFVRTNQNTVNALV